MRSCTDASLRSRERTSGKNLGYLEHTRSTGGSQRRVHAVDGPRKRGGSRYRVGSHVNRTYLVHGFSKRGVVRCGAHTYTVRILHASPLGPLNIPHTVALQQGKVLTASLQHGSAPPLRPRPRL